MSSRSTQSNYINKDEETQDDSEKLDEEVFLAEFALEKMHKLERSGHARSLEPCSAAEIAEMMAALGPSDSDDAAPDPVPQPVEWLADFKALARKHRPFSTNQKVEILRVLNAVEDPALEARR